MILGLLDDEPPRPRKKKQRPDLISLTDDALVDKRAAGELLNLSRSTVRRWQKSGKLPPLVHGRYRLGDLRAIARGQTP